MNSAEDSAARARLLFLFVDGLGLREAAPDNPVNENNAPTLCRLLRRHAVSLDACLGVPGLPQSATGQAALFTGVNMAKLMGRHVAGFPGPRLREGLLRDNLFLALTRRGLACKFANGYAGVTGPEDIARRRLRSVTTVMALTVPASISTLADLLAGRAVAEDLTRSGLRERGFDVPTIAPEEAASHLATLSRAHAFVLFEFFQSDRAGHAPEPGRAEAVLQTYDRFLACLLDSLRGTPTLLVLTSDHGNIEEMFRRTHTRNPVPLVAVGPGEEAFRTGVTDLTGVFPAVLRWFAVSC